MPVCVSPFRCIQTTDSLYEKKLKKDELQKLKEQKLLQSEKGKEKLQSPVISLLNTDGKAPFLIAII